MASVLVPMHVTERDEDETNPLVKYYQATELIPSKKPLLHNIFSKQLAAWASTQVVSGAVTFGLGLVFASTSVFNERLLTIFRVPLSTGLLFFIAGLLSILLYKEPRLLPVCFFVNIFCIVFTGLGIGMICADLHNFVNATDNYYKIEILVLFVCIFETIVSAVLIFWIHREQRNLKKS